MSRSTYNERVLEKLSKLPPEEIEVFLKRITRRGKFWKELFEAMLDGVIVLHKNLEIMYANRAARETLGRAGRDIEGRRLPELVPEGEFSKIVSRFALDHKPVRGMEVELPGGSQPRWVSVSIVPLTREQERDTDAVLMLIHDTTELHQAQEQRQRAERATTLATLAAGLAHEIKNPLNSLQIHAQLLQRALRERAKKSRKPADWSRPLQSCDIIVQEIVRLSEVVNRFLTAVRPSRPLFQRANINHHIERVLATMQPEIEQKGIQLTTRFDHEIPPVDFDPQQMSQVLLNLVKNAIEALEGRPSPRIEVRTALEETSFVIVVRDNGVGIPREELQRIFQAYYTTKSTGTGLGLAIVARVVEEHRGKISIDSDVQEGTTVMLRFPLENRPIRLLESQNSETAESRDRRDGEPG